MLTSAGFPVVLYMKADVIFAVAVRTQALILGNAVKAGLRENLENTSVSHRLGIITLRKQVPIAG